MNRNVVITIDKTHRYYNGKYQVLYGNEWLSPKTSIELFRETPVGQKIPQTEIRPVEQFDKGQIVYYIKTGKPYEVIDTGSQFTGHGVYRDWVLIRNDNGKAQEIFSTSFTAHKPQR